MEPMRRDTNCIFKLIINEIIKQIIIKKSLLLYVQKKKSEMKENDENYQCQGWYEKKA